MTSATSFVIMPVARPSCNVMVARLAQIHDLCDRVSGKSMGISETSLSVPVLVLAEPQLRLTVLVEPQLRLTLTHVTLGITLQYSFVFICWKVTVHAETKLDDQTCVGHYGPACHSAK